MISRMLYLEKKEAAEHKELGSGILYHMHFLPVAAEADKAYIDAEKERLKVIQQRKAEERATREAAMEQARKAREDAAAKKAQHSPHGDEHSSFSGMPVIHD